MESFAELLSFSLCFVLKRGLGGLGTFNDKEEKNDDDIVYERSFKGGQGADGRLKAQNERSSARGNGPHRDTLHWNTAASKFEPGMVIYLVAEEIRYL
jgi:hypothetical protein